MDVLNTFYLASWETTLQNVIVYFMLKFRLKYDTFFPTVEQHVTFIVIIIIIYTQDIVSNHWNSVPHGYTEYILDVDELDLTTHSNFPFKLTHNYLARNRRSSITSDVASGDSPTVNTLYWPSCARSITGEWSLLHNCYQRILLFFALDFLMQQRSIKTYSAQTNHRRQWCQGV